MVCFDVLLILLVALSNVYGQESCTETEKNTIRLNTLSINTINFDGTTGAGRVEICYCSGITCSWSTINAEGSAWSWPNTLIACRELGHSTTYNPILGSFVTLDSDVQVALNVVPIYPNYFNCDGTEATLSQCRNVSNPSGVQHSRDVFVQCDTSVTLLLKSVRLTGSIISSSGVVEVYLSSTDGWVTICPSQWDDNDASVVCRELGYEGGTATQFDKSLYI